MAAFDFITDDDLRASLESDMGEMASCLQSESYKAAQVLAGSIVEALLTDYLAGTGFKHKSKALLDLTLGELLTAAKDDGVLSATTTELASVVKEYRNLIHPGRVIRTRQGVTAHTARIAQDVVEIITDDVARKKASTYGLTAKQIVGKVESDPSSGPIIGDLIREAAPAELERLLLQTVPDRYLELSSMEEGGVADVLSAVRRTFHAAMDVAPDEVRRKVMQRYVKILKEQSQFEVLRFEEAFFRATDLASLPPSDAAAARAHLLDQINKDFGPRLEGALDGFGAVATTEELEHVAAAVMRWVAGNTTSERQDIAERVLRSLWNSAPPGSKKIIPAALFSWERGTGPAAWMSWLQSTRRSMGDFSVVRRDSGFDDTEIDELPF